MKRLFLIFLFLLIACPAWGATYYISTSGNNDNNGLSEETPWKTLSKCGTYVLAAGDTIKLKAGDIWTGQHCSINKANITLTSYGVGDKPEIRSSNVISGTWSSVGDGVYSLAVADLRNATICWQDEDTVLIKAANAESLSASGMFYPDTVAGVLYIRTTDDADPSTHTIELSSSSTGIDLSFASGAIIIDGLRILHGDDSIYSGIRVQSSNSLAGTRIRNCDIGPVGGVGIHIIAPNVIAEYNYIHKAWNGKAYGSGGTGCGIKFNSATTNGSVARFNIIEDSYQGISVESGAINNKAYYNIVKNSRVNSVGMFNGTSTAPNYFYNNTIIHNPSDAIGGHGLHIQLSSGQGGYYAYNNIVYHLYTGGGDSQCFCIDSSSYSNINEDYNLCYIPEGGTGVVGKLGHTNYATLAEWKTALNATSYTGKDAHSLNSDPLFISATNYHLQSESPARGAGVNVGLSSTNPPDIGAEPYKQYVPWR